MKIVTASITVILTSAFDIQSIETDSPVNIKIDHERQLVILETDADIVEIDRINKTVVSNPVAAEPASQGDVAPPVNIVDELTKTFGSMFGSGMGMGIAVIDGEIDDARKILKQMGFGTNIL
jgi:hypothetical protein